MFCCFQVLNAKSLRSYQRSKLNFSTKDSEALCEVFRDYFLVPEDQNQARSASDSVSESDIAETMEKMMCSDTGITKTMNCLHGASDNRPIHGKQIYVWNVTRKIIIMQHHTWSTLPRGSGGIMYFDLWRRVNFSLR